MNSNNESSERTLLQLVKQLIHEKRYDAIGLLFEKESNISYLQNNTSEFTELCKKYMNEENYSSNNELYFVCEHLLKSLAKYSFNTEILFELLEIIDSVESDNVFTSALKALQVCLLREESDRKSLDWGLNEVIGHVVKLHIPDFLIKGYDEKQKSLLEQDANIHSILICYITITIFYEPILKIELENLVAIDVYRNTDWNKLNVLASFLLKLLGRPLDFHRNFSSFTSSAVFINQLCNSTYGQRFPFPFSLSNKLPFGIDNRKFSRNLNNLSIDDFRAREEAKEEEYLKQEAEKEKEAKTEKEDKVKEDKLVAVRLKILESSLPFVEQYGWTIDAITNGAEKAGLPGVVHGLFENGSIELILYFYSKCNSNLFDYLKNETNNGLVVPENPTNFIEKAIRYRLECLIPYKKNWPQALAKMSLPQNVPKSLAQILTMIDDICYFSGDRSVDFGWYTRRVAISTIYKLTELYMIQDTSINHKATWEFLKNRIDEAKYVEILFGQSGEPSQRTKNKLNATFETARNILGLNYDRRI